MGKFLYVKTEFCQKSRPVFLRFFALTFHNFRRRSRRNVPLPGKRNRDFKELSTFPTDFSTSIFSLYFNAYPENIQKMSIPQTAFCLFPAAVIRFP